jgi:hypothetical protein
MSCIAAMIKNSAEGNPTSPVTKEKHDPGLPEVLLTGTTTAAGLLIGRAAGAPLRQRAAELDARHSPAFKKLNLQVMMMKHPPEGGRDIAHEVFVETTDAWKSGEKAIIRKWLRMDKMQKILRHASDTRMVAGGKVGLVSGLLASCLYNKLQPDVAPVTAPPSTQYVKQASSIHSRLRHACEATNAAPTDKQKESGAYAKGEFDFKGIKIKIENPKGSIRSGSDKDGKAWSNKMLHSYGYFKGTKAIDGDAVDVFIGPDLDSDMVVVIDQECEGKYDESKFVIGVKSKEQGEDVYLSAYAKGWKLGSVSTTTIQQLKVWLKEGSTKKPFKGQMLKAASVESLFRAAMTARAISSAASPSAVGRRSFLSRLWRNVAPHAVPDRPVEQALAKAISAATSAKPLDAFSEATLARTKFNSPSIPMLRPAGDLSDAFTDAGELAAARLVLATPNAAAKLPRVSTLAVLPGTYDRRSFLKRLGVATAVDSGVAPTVGRISAGLVNAAGKVGELFA